MLQALISSLFLALKWDIKAELHVKQNHLLVVQQHLKANGTDTLKGVQITYHHREGQDMMILRM